MTSASTSAKALSTSVGAALRLSSSVVVIARSRRRSLAGDQDLGREIAQGDMKHHRVVLEERWVRDMGRRSNGREHDQIAGPHELFHIGGNRDGAVALETAGRASELLTLGRRRVVEPY